MMTPDDHKVAVYVADVEHIKDKFRDIFEREPKTWRCPCDIADCSALVVYVRGPDDRIYFMATQTLKATPPYPTIVIDNVEDFALFLQSRVLPAGDLFAYGIWLKQGLKEALLSA